jgi:homoserine O-acetyltransferase
VIAVYGENGAPRTVLVAHALTGSSRVLEWWPGVAGTGRLFDPADWRIVGIDVPGDPNATLRDVVAEQKRALAARGIDRLDVVIGGSLGGMQALQWAVDFPESVAHAIAIGAHDHQTAMGIAYNAVQRDAIAIDPARGLRLARKIAMLTYKSDALFAHRHDRRQDRNGRARFDVEGYLEHQADKFERRFDPSRYVALTHIMDSFDVRSATTRGRRLPKLIFVGISTDLLFRPDDIRIAAERFKARGYDTEYLDIESDHGHDAFLAESEKLVAILRETETHAKTGELGANSVALDRA